MKKQEVRKMMGHKIYVCDEDHKDRVKEILEKATETLTFHPNGKEGCGKTKVAIEFSQRDYALMEEAFMVGRIYSATGEKESPIEINDKLHEKCRQALKQWGLSR